MTRPTALGSWPGTDVRSAQRAVRDILGEAGLPYLPELPDRGPGADMIGRAAGLLIDLPVDLQPVGWRLVDHPGRDAARTVSLWRQDLDELAETYDGYEGELKVQVAGPMTLAASVWLHRGERLVVDPGAVRDLTESLAEGVRLHLAEVQRLVPGARLVLQLDEPSLPAVLAGRLPTASGYGVLRAIDPAVARDRLRAVVDAVGERPVVVHCCADGVPMPLLRSVGVGLAVDTAQLSAKGWESVATSAEEGTDVWLGILATSGDLPSARDAATRLLDRWADLGMDGASLAAATISPACGLAGRTIADAVATHRRLVEIADAVTTEVGV